MARDDPRLERARRLAPFFAAQLQLARRLAALTGAPLGEAARAHTCLHRRFGLGRPDAGPPGAAWQAFAAALEATDDPAAHVAAAVAAFIAGADEALPLPGQVAFGCFACEPPDPAGDVRIHFHNLDTDAAGGPLAAPKQGRRRAELAALVQHVATTWPDARRIRGGSWLYHVEAYRRLFPPAYLAAITPHPGPTLSGSSSWGQLIDGHERIRPAVRDALLANLHRLDPERPWAVFPYPPLVPVADLATFHAHCGTLTPSPPTAPDPE